MPCCLEGSQKSQAWTNPHFSCSSIHELRSTDSKTITYWSPARFPWDARCHGCDGEGMTLFQRSFSREAGHWPNHRVDVFTVTAIKHRAFLGLWNLARTDEWKPRNAWWLTSKKPTTEIMWRRGRRMREKRRRRQALRYEGEVLSNQSLLYLLFLPLSTMDVNWVWWWHFRPKLLHPFRHVPRAHLHLRCFSKKWGQWHFPKGIWGCVPPWYTHQSFRRLTSMK